jgi:hypothetical protein
MKKMIKNLLITSTLALSMGLVGCDKVTAEPKNGSDKIVNFTDDSKSYFRNDIEYIYDTYRDSSDATSTIFNQVLQLIAKKEVAEFVSEEKIQELCEEVMVNKVRNNNSYETDHLFQEEKFARELNAKNGKVVAENGYNNDYLIGPEDTFETIFKADYTNYINEQVKPDVLKKLLTAKYLCERDVSSLSRSISRNVQYIKLKNITGHAGAVNNLINQWLGNYVANPTETIDLDDLQDLYKGIKVENNSLHVVNSTYYTLYNEILDDLKEITDEQGHLLSADDTDASIESKYTSSSGKYYPVSYGKELAERELAQKDFNGDDLYTKSQGITDLPSEISNRLFSSSIASYLQKVEGGVSFLTPATTLNGTNLGKYYHYDSSSDAYYIVVVNEYYTSSKIDTLIKDNTDASGKITYVDALVDIAYALADSSTNQNQAILYYLDEYAVADNLHDEVFYDYIKANYPTIVKD